MPIDAFAFSVSPSSGLPIFRQIVDQVHSHIATGTLEHGDMLPSTRELAAVLQVNMMTISKAYQILAADGVVENVRGRGMRCIAEQRRQPASQRKSEFEALLRPVIHRARTLGLSDQQVRRIVERLLKKSH